MTVHFETTNSASHREGQETSRLRLDRDTFNALIGHVTGQVADSTRVHALRDAGVLRGDSVDPRLAEGLDAVTFALCRLELHSVDRSGRRERGQGWVAGHAAALLLDLPDGPAGPWCEFLTIHPTFLPEMLARFAVLGPRPRPRAVPFQIPPAALDELVSADPARRAAALPQVTGAAPAHEVTATATTLGDGLRRRWQVTAHWAAAKGASGERSLDVLDTTGGLWLVEAQAGMLTVWPTTPSAVWRALVVLLPRDAELSS